MKLYTVIYSESYEDMDTYEPMILSIISYDSRDIYDNTLNIDDATFELAGIGSKDDFFDRYRFEIGNISFLRHTTLQGAIHDAVKIVFNYV